MKAIFAPSLKHIQCLRLLLSCVGLACTLLISTNLRAENTCIKNEDTSSSYQRIVSIGGAITETIYALGQGHRIVATDTTSYFPEEADKTPKVGYQRALSVEGILSTLPDIIIASDQAGPEKAIKQLKQTNIEFIRLSTAMSIDQVTENIDQLGKILCANQQSKVLISSIKNKQLKFSMSETPSQQKVLFIMQHNGGAPMVAGRSTSAANIIQLSGAINAVNQFDGYKPLTPEALLLAKPDVILTTDLGLEQSGGNDAILSLPGVLLTPAGATKSIISMDSLLLLGFGPRTIEAAELLQQKLSSTL